MRVPSLKGGLSGSRPAALPAGDLRRLTSRRPQGLCELPAPLADAGRSGSFPTGSMGIGPISSILPRALHALPDAPAACWTAPQRTVWGVFGDGEMDEPESMSALTLASAREAGQPGVGGQLQPAAAGRPGARQRPHRRRVGAPVRRCRLARRSSCLWGSDWDGLFARDSARARCCAHFANTVDGQMQTFAAKDGRYNRDHLLRARPRTGPPGARHDRRADRRA